MTPEPTVTPIPRTRRAVLAAAVGGLAATLLGRVDPAKAAAGDALIMGSTTNSAGTFDTSLTTTSPGTALLVTQTGSGTALRGSAVGTGSIAGFFTANNGTGISGVTGTGSTYGVFGQNNGGTDTGGAIRAAGGNNFGLVATTNNNFKFAVNAINNSAHPGTLGFCGAIRAEGNNTPGVWATSNSTTGVYGASNGGKGVEGSSSSGYGVYGGSSSSVGVFGTSASGVGVTGNSTTNDGVQGLSGSGYGLYGFSASNYAAFLNGTMKLAKYLDVESIATPANPASSTVRLFVRDTLGCIQVCARFPSGAETVLAFDGTCA
jgi:hypothetical protein